MNAPPAHFADRLALLCRQRGAPVCVGLDPVFERLPQTLRDQAQGERHRDESRQRVTAIERYCVEVIEAVVAHVPCVKVQAGCFERYRAAGFEAMFRVIAAARQRGLQVILDAKRGDIGPSAAHYAAGLLEGGDSADALTVNAYLGADALQPFIDVAVRQRKGLFALVRTSNPGSDQVQSLVLKNEQSVAQAVGAMVAEAGGARPDYLGETGDSLLGAVVGATKPTDIAALRRAMPRQIFLVPGFGAQGGGVAEVRPCFRGDGTGALVTASRSVIYAYEKGDADDWRKAVGEAARQFNEQLREVTTP